MCKRFKKVAAGAVSALTAVSLLSVNAGAACMQTGDYSVRLYGKLTDAMSDNTVNIQIFMPGKTVEDLYRADKEDFKSIVAYQNEIECDENGEYSITVEVYITHFCIMTESSAKKALCTAILPQAKRHSSDLMRQQRMMRFGTLLRSGSMTWGSIRSFLKKRIRKIRFALFLIG